MLAGRAAADAGVVEGARANAEAGRAVTPRRYALAIAVTVAA